MINSKATRDGYGDGLVDLGKRDERIVVLTADLKESTRVEEFAKMFPDRFIECGVAEQNMMGIAAGLAAAGKIPFVSSYAVFSPGRNWDQLRVSVCYSNLPVKIIGAHTGLSVGPDGATHQALEDVAITRVLPNITVVVPVDYWETKKSVMASVDVIGPVYIRFGREKTPIVTSEDTDFKIGKSWLMTDNGNDVLIAGAGPILSEALKVAYELKSEGIGVKVLNCHTIKPIDRDLLVGLANECKAVVTVEEHQVMGGVGSAICEVLGKFCPVPVEMIGMSDSFGESGKPEELAEKYHLLAKDIIEAVKKVISRK